MSMFARIAPMSVNIQKEYGEVIYGLPYNGKELHAGVFNLWGSDSPKLASLQPEVCKSLICRRMPSLCCNP
jgi:hypothetical protein